MSLADQIAVYDVGNSIQRRLYVLPINSPTAATNIELTKNNRHLVPADAFLAASVAFNELGANQIYATFVLRFDLLLEEDVWLKKVVAFILSSIATPTTSYSVQLQIFYLQVPSTNPASRLIYDETVTSGNLTGATNFARANLPSRSLNELLAKGSTLAFVLTITSLNAGTASIVLYGTSTGGERSWVELDFAPANSAKDTEVSNTKAVPSS